MNYESNLLLRNEDLVNNPTARVPVCLCLDTSGSMDGLPIEELNRGVQLFYDAIREDEMALYSAEISVVTFGGRAQCMADFASLEVQPAPPVLSANGLTPMGEAVNLALDLLERRKEEYKSKGVDYYQPWLVLMTDGGPNGNKEELDRAMQRTKELIGRKKLTMFPIGIGPEADMNVLSMFTPDGRKWKLDGLKFREFFAWLSKSVAQTSQSTPGEPVEPDWLGVKNWEGL